MDNANNNEEQYASELKTEIANLLFASNRRSLIATVIVASALVVVQKQLVSLTHLSIWLVLLTAAYSLRTLLTVEYHRLLPAEQDVNKWLKRFRLFSGLCGLAWGAGGVLLFPPNDIAHQAFLIFALVGVAGGAVIVYSIDMVCSNLFVAGLLIPTTLQLLHSGSRFSIAIAMLFIVFVIYITMAGRTLAGNLYDNIKLKITAKHDSDRVHQLAYYDVLTGLPNRRLLSNYLKQLFITCEKQQQYGALLFLDLDDFKNINDLRGHNAGDQLLQQVGKRLQDSLRQDDFVARVGGDEFVVILGSVGNEKLQAYQASQVVADALMHKISQPFLIDHTHYHSTASIGACIFFSDEFDEAEVLRRADIAMYEAKRLGHKSTLQFYDDTKSPALQHRAALESDLRLVLQNHQLVVNYQVQVDQHQTAVGAELLLRWNHPALGFVSPSDFITMAEESGEIISIGRWALVEACKQLKDWETKRLYDKLKISVNVSALQFSQPDFVDNVISTIEEIGCAPNLLRIELTESIILQNIEFVVEKMHALKRVGITFSMDDFGTGYSSLSMLKKLPLDELKIDRSFINDLHNSQDDQFIAQTIISMGQNLGLAVIAEGVETEQQRQLLQDYGCHYYQGYLFGKPMAIKDFEAEIFA